MSHISSFNHFLDELVLVEDQQFDFWLDTLLESRWPQPESKDVMRIDDIQKKASKLPTPEKVKEKELSLANQMAKSIKDMEKALRRARAAFNKGLMDIAEPFYRKAVELGASDLLEPQEKDLVRGSVMAKKFGM
jgi:hypothetical protein